MIARVKINKIFQTQIDDTANAKLCVWWSTILIAWSLRKRQNRVLEPLTLEDFNRLNDACIKDGGLAKGEGEGNSKDGWVLNHEKCAEAVGLTGYKKVYEPITIDAKDKFDTSKILNLLQWGSLVELRDEGKHSLIATGWYRSGGKFYCEVADPWPYTDDTRFDAERCMTQRYVKGKWFDSRSIEYFGWFYKLGTEPRWIE